MRLRLVENATPQTVTLTYCRVQNYACAAPVTMDLEASGEHTGTIPWRDAFFRGVTHVGYAFLIRFAEAEPEHSPLVNWPTTPPGLPVTDARYYFYELPPEETRSVPLPALGLVAALAAASWLARPGRG